MSDFVHYGVWINWSRGKVDGSTITLTPRSAGVLVAFLAIFVSVAGGSLWRILAFFLHQYRVTRSPQDGLHYQQQAVLRNTATPGVASWQLIWLIPPWRKLSRRPFWRSLSLILLALINLGVFFAAGILVAEVTRTAGSEVLVSSPNCGNWTLKTEKLVFGFQNKALNDTVNGATYARACYGGPSNALQCNQYGTQSLPYTKSENDSCPFAEGMCLTKFPVLTLDTGNLSTHDHLGINSEHQDRVLYRRRTTCAPLKDKGFIVTMNYTDTANMSLGDVVGSPGDVIDFYNFGPVVWESRPRDNFTFFYNRRAASVGYGYNLASVDHISGDGVQNLWQPDKAVLRSDGDVSLMFLSANDVKYTDKVEDPIYQATTPIGSLIDDGNNVTLYTSDYFVNPLGCVDQHQFCNPNNQACTKLDSYYSAVISAQKDLKLNPMQYGVVSTMSLNLVLTTISQNIGGRGNAALRAQEIMSGLYSGPLPTDQWKNEVEYWFTTGLSKLQKYFVDYATGPTDVLDGTYISKPYDAPSRQLCDSQKIKAPPGSGATSFSTLGVAIILAVGGLIILTHTILEFLVSSVYSTRTYKLVRWALDDKLQLQRLAFEGAGMGSWNAGIGAVPTTTNNQRFGMEIAGEKERLTVSVVTDEEKGPGAVMIEHEGSPLTPSMSKSSSDRRFSPSVERNDSLQLPPMEFEHDDRGIWPLVNDNADSARISQTYQGIPPHHPEDSYEDSAPTRFR